jgi:hypothetical protein
MEKSKIDRIVEHFRSLKEDGGMMTTGSTAGKAGFGGSAQGFDPGPTAGYDKVIGAVRKRKIIGLGKGSRNRWKKPQ